MRTRKSPKGNIRMMLAQMWSCVGKRGFSGVRERIRVRQELGKTRAGARENTENDDITEDAQNYGNIWYSPNITVTWVTRVSR